MLGSHHGIVGSVGWQGAEGSPHPTPPRPGSGPQLPGCPAVDAAPRQSGGHREALCLSVAPQGPLWPPQDTPGPRDHMSWVCSQACPGGSLWLTEKSVMYKSDSICLVWFSVSRKKKNRAFAKLQVRGAHVPLWCREFTALIFLCVGLRLQGSVCPEEGWQSLISVVPWSCTQVGTW